MSYYASRLWRTLRRATAVNKAMHQLNDMTAVRSGVRLAVFLDQIEAMNPETEFWQTLSSGKAPQFLDGAPHRGEGGATTLIYDGGKLVGVSVCQRDENNRTVLVCVDLRPANSD